MARTLEQIKNDVAKKYGHSSWSTVKVKCFKDTVSGSSDMEAFMNEVCISFANSKLEEAAETVNMQRDYTYADGKVEKEYYKKCVIGAYMYTIDKQSILNLREDV